MKFKFLHTQKIVLIILVQWFGYVYTSHAQNQSMAIDTVTAAAGQTITVHVTAQSFTHVIGFQGSITWDPLSLSLQSVQGNAIFGLSNYMFDIANATNGVLTYVYTNAVSNINPVNHTSLFSLTFVAQQNTTINFSNNPTNLMIDTAADIAGLSDLASINGSYINGYYHTPNIPLSVTLNTLLVETTVDGNILQWQTLNETYATAFIIQRSTNAIDFENIGTVKPLSDNNNQNATCQYQFIDKQPLTDQQYYRLLYVDMDGKVTYSNMVYTKKGLHNPLQVYPNPTQHIIYVQVTNDDIGSRISLTDIAGNLIFSNIISSNEFSINTASLRNGMYYLHIGNTYTEKILKK